MPIVSLSTRDPRLLRALQYFDAVARIGTVKGAADAMSVSASAVSHQLRGLSEMIGEELFDRKGRGIALTEAGRALANHLEAAFSEIDTVISELTGAGRRSVRLAVCSSFGPSWLAPRLTQFLAQHPLLDVELRLFAQDPVQSQSTADAMVTADPIRVGYDSVSLFDEFLVAISKPDSGRDRDAAAETLITTDPDPQNLGADWHDYCSALHLNHASRCRNWLRCSHYILALELAKSGAGIALVPDFIAAGPIATGAVEYFNPTRVPSGRTYRLAFKQSHASDPTIRALARWLKQQVQKTPAMVSTNVPVATEAERL